MPEEAAGIGLQHGFKLTDLKPAETGLGLFPCHPVPDFSISSGDRQNKNGPHCPKGYAVSDLIKRGIKDARKFVLTVHQKEFVNREEMLMLLVVEAETPSLLRLVVVASQGKTSGTTVSYVLNREAADAFQKHLDDPTNKTLFVVTRNADYCKLGYLQ